MAFLLVWWLHAPEWLTTKGFHFSNSPVPPLLPELLPFFGLLQFGALIAFILGWKVRLSAVLAWLCFLYSTLVDRTSAYSINNIYLFSLATFFVFPASPRESTVPAAQIRILQIGMVAIYFSAGWNKAVWGAWLDSPTALQSSISGIYMTDFAAWCLQILPSWFWRILQYSTICFELFSPVLFGNKRLRIVAIIIGCGFHIGIALCMDQLILFSLQMMSFYVLFFSFESKLVTANAEGIGVVQSSENRV